MVKKGYTGGLYLFRSVLALLGLLLHHKPRQGYRT